MKEWVKIQAMIAKEINGPSWGPKKNRIDIDELQKKIEKEELLPE